MQSKEPDGSTYPTFLVLLLPPPTCLGAPVVLDMKMDFPSFFTTTPSFSIFLPSRFLFLPVTISYTRERTVFPLFWHALITYLDAAERNSIVRHMFQSHCASYGERNDTVALLDRETLLDAVSF